MDKIDEILQIRDVYSKNHLLVLNRDVLIIEVKYQHHMMIFFLSVLLNKRFHCNK